MFIFRKLFFLAIVLVAVFLGASVVLESFAESQLSTGVGRSLGLQARPTVQIDAFPILYRIMQGKIPGIQVVARDLVLQHLEIAELDIDMHDVHADIGVLIRSDRFDLLVEKGEGSARISEDAVNAYLVYQKVDVHVTLRPDSTVFVRADRVVGGRTRRFEATGRLTLDERKLIFKPTRVTVDAQTSSVASLNARARAATAFSVELPKLPGNILPSEVVVTKGQVALVAILKNYVLRLAKGAA
jgi:hypothetical protein